MPAALLTSLVEKMMINNEENIYSENNSLKADNDTMRKEIGKLNKFIEQLKVRFTPHQLATYIHMSARIENTHDQL